MALKKGDKAPSFKLQNTSGKEVSLADFTGKKPVIILFFPLAFSSVCTKELCSVRDDMPRYAEMGAEVLGISVDSFFTLAEFKKAQNLPFTLLSDFNKDVSEKYGALYDEFYGMKGVSKRAAFVVGTDGKISYAEVLDDASEIPDFDAIKTALS